MESCAFILALALSSSNRYANAELLIMPGETATLKWVPERVGIVPIYCTDFCSALHQEMQGYVRVSPANSKVPLTFSLGDTAPAGDK